MIFGTQYPHEICHKKVINLYLTCIRWLHYLERCKKSYFDNCYSYMIVDI